MSRTRLLAFLTLLAILAFSLLPQQEPAKPVCPGPLCPAPQPSPPLPPLQPRRPWGPGEGPAVAGKPQLGGKTSPDGTVEITCDLPASEKKHNVGGRDGAGLCVFTSIEYCARWANEERLFDLQEKMRHERGGGWPAKVDDVLARYGAGVEYLQYEGNDPAVLRAAIASGLMCGVTYNGHDPHYNQSIAHMVSLCHLDDRWACITDNNFPGDNQFVWMSPGEFYRRWKGGGSSGWAVVLLNPPPPPPPRR